LKKNEAMEGGKKVLPLCGGIETNGLVAKKMDYPKFSQTLKGGVHEKTMKKQGALERRWAPVGT